MHSKQWHYSLHRDFQNCYSTRRSPTGFFSSNSTRVPIHLHPHTTYTCTLQSREFSIQNPILHAEDKELFEYYYWCESRIQKRNSMHRRQGDLLEIHPCVLQDIPGIQPQDLPKALQLLQTFQRHSSYYRHSSLSRHSSLPRHSNLSRPSRRSSRSRHSRDIPDIPVIHDLPAFPGNSTNSTDVSVSPGNPPHSRHSPIRMHILHILHILQFYSSIGFHRKLRRVPVGQLQLQTTKHYILQRKGDVVISVNFVSVKMSR